MRERASFDRDPSAPSLARRTLARWLVDRVDRRILEDATLLVSELVTNAVRHSGANGAIDMTVAVRGDHLRVEVSDPGEGFARPAVGEPPPDALGGRGLLIVDRVAASWGVTEGRPTRVWFELSPRERGR
jgi:anti-sigma regulatory factor (Ser/Thr protein kinase)